ncbi:hypothetical protein [Megalodesulfovibrio gigas]|uniref:Uncharacterized protein n=1 Tax=Megalodesulfovibrio gigas (strain ATCC 19364 / DSM 1382 / NCIMB 9332 / VKM B-1759) TaxID=1121448 RepID=T2GF10_MEGG1|nr:hypothetical protein [Megalodesulfovibrio gigas]AGW14701.1 hypothetical protein DGI_2977 [Megalodesulfovibrio gigas DSM 1382 = ATCC 19364]
MSVFSRDDAWAAIKEWTRYSQSSVGKDLHDMATWYEGRKKLGLLPPDAAALGTPPEYVQQQRDELRAAQQQAAAPPSATQAAATGDMAEARSGAIVHEKA